MFKNVHQECNMLDTTLLMINLEMLLTKSGVGLGQEPREEGEGRGKYKIFCKPDVARQRQGSDGGKYLRAQEGGNGGSSNITGR